MAVLNKLRVFDIFFVEGRVQVSKDAQFLRIMEAPCVFGELAILYHCERTATVKGRQIISYF